jgi:hypothetical protein
MVMVEEVDVIMILDDVDDDDEKKAKRSKMKIRKKYEKEPRLNVDIFMDAAI